MPLSRSINLPSGSVCWPVAALGSTAQDVCHVATKICSTDRGGERSASGSTRWERRLADANAWVEWDWVVLCDGVVVQADPLSVRSNVLLLDACGRPLLSSRRRATLATLVYLLPWQGPVLDKLRDHAPRTQPAESRPAAHALN